MLYQKQNGLQESNNNLQPAPAGRNTARIYIHNYSAKDLKQSILPLHSVSCPLEELISVGEAVFEFIRNAEDMELSTRNAFGQLEKLFDFYKNLIELKA